MSKNIIIAGFLLCLFLSQETSGQERVNNKTMTQALIFRPNQDAIRGNLVEIRDENIVVLSSEREITIPFAEITRIILTFEHGPARGSLYGAVLAGYASASIYAAARDHGRFYESQELPWYALVVVPSIALGAGIGYLVDPSSSQKEEVFDFTGDDESKALEKSHLVNRVTHRAYESKVHITFQGSHVYSNILKVTLPGSNSFYNDNEMSEFNLLRKAQVTYSVVPEMEVGIALVCFNTPPQFNYGDESPGNGESKSYYVSQSFDATGKYVVASYNPLYHLLDSRLNLKIGCGLGAASIAYTRTSSVSTYRQGNSSSEAFALFNVSNNFVVGYLFGQLEFDIVDGLSIGLAADKVLGPSKNSPAVPEAHIAAQTLRLDNTSLGFTLSAHF